MFFLEIFIFLISLILISLSIVGYGAQITRNLQSNIYNDFFFGLIIISLLITVYHFFFRINIQTNIFIFILGLVFFLQKTFYTKSNNLKIFKLKYLLIIILLVPMYISQKYHEDFGYYHLPYALAFIEEKIVFGFANIDQSYVYNSIWLNLTSIFFYFNKSFDYLTLPSFILFLFFILFSLNNLFTKKVFKVSDYYLILCLFYFILKFTRISEFGIDLPAIIFSVLSIYYFIKYFEVNSVSKKRELFFFNLAFSIFSILIKLSTLPIIILTIYIYLKDFKYIKYHIFNLRFLIVYILVVVFIIQQFIYTGCFFFPTILTCLNVDWFNDEYIYLAKKLELINKSYSIARDSFTPKEYLSNFNWFSYWIKRNYIEIFEHLATIIVPFLTFIFFLEKKNVTKFEFKIKGILTFIILLNLLFWFNFSPVYRFGIHIFLTLSFIFFYNLFLERKFSKKVFIIFISIFLIFNFSKNFIRIKNENDVFIGIKKIENSYVLNNHVIDANIKFYQPDIENNKENGWQGRLCWNIPFVCSYNRLNVKKKNGYFIINKLKN